MREKAATRKSNGPTRFRVSWSRWLPSFIGAPGQQARRAPSSLDEGDPSSSPIPWSCSLTPPHAAMSSLDLTSLLVGHTALTLLASLSSSPAWNVPLALYGLVTVQRLDGANGAEAARTFVAVTGASMLLDFIWFVSNSTHGLARILILLNFFLKPITLMSTLSQLSSRGEGFSSGNFSLPGGLADRISGGFPPFGGQSGHGQSETVWSAPQQHTAPPGSYQGRFSLDDDLEGGGAGSGASTPSTLGKKVSLHTGQQVPAKQAAKTPLPPPSSSTSAAEGGGYHSLA